MKKTGNIYWAIFAIFGIIFLMNGVYAEGSCGDDDQLLYRLSGDLGAHAEKDGETNGGYFDICFEQIFGKKSASNPDEEIILYLDSSSNSHASSSDQTPSVYPIRISGIDSCRVINRTNSNKNSDEYFVALLSDRTNAHLAKPTLNPLPPATDYPIGVVCKLPVPIEPVEQTPEPVPINPPTCNSNYNGLCKSSCSTNEKIEGSGTCANQGEVCCVVESVPPPTLEVIERFNWENYNNLKGSLSQTYDENFELNYKVSVNGINQDLRSKNIDIYTFDIPKNGRSVNYANSYLVNKFIYVSSDGDKKGWWWLNGWVHTGDINFLSDGWAYFDEVWFYGDAVRYIGSSPDTLNADWINFDNLNVYDILPIDFSSDIEGKTPKDISIITQYGKRIDTLSSPLDSDGDGEYTYSVSASSLKNNIKQYIGEDKIAIAIYGLPQSSETNLRTPLFTLKNSRPEAEIDKPQDISSALINEPIDFSGLCNDIDGGTPSGSWNIEGVTIPNTDDEQTEDILNSGEDFTGYFRTSGQKTISYTCTDELGASSLDTMTMNIVVPNHKQIMAISNITDESRIQLSALSFFPTFLDILVNGAYVREGNTITLVGSDSYVLNVSYDAEGKVDEVRCLRGNCPNSYIDKTVGDLEKRGNLDNMEASWFDNDILNTEDDFEFVVDMSGAEPKTIKLSIEYTGETGGLEIVKVEDNLILENSDEEVSIDTIESNPITIDASQVALPFFSIGYIISVIVVIVLIYAIKLIYFDSKRQNKTKEDSKNNIKKKVKTK